MWDLLLSSLVVIGSISAAIVLISLACSHTRACIRGDHDE